MFQKITGITVAVIATAITGSYLLFMKHTKEKKKKKKKKKQRKKKSSIVSKSQLIDFTKDFSNAIDACFRELAKEEYRIKMNLHQKGQKMPFEEELHSYLKAEFQNKIQTKEQNLYNDHCITETGARAASKKYKNDPEYKDLRKNIEKKYEVLATPPNIPLLDEFIKLLQGLSDLLSQVWIEIIHEISRRGNESQKEFEERVKNCRDLKKIPKLTELRKKFNIKENRMPTVLQMGMRRYGSNPEVIKISQYLENIEFKHLKALGIR